MSLGKKNKGFTIIEVIVVVSILVILSAVAVPVFLGVKEQAMQGVEIAYAANIADAINLHNADESLEPITSAGWSSESDMIDALGAGNAPRFSDTEAMEKAFTRIVFNGKVAMVNASIE